MGRNLLTVNEASKLLEVTPQTVSRLIREGVFHPIFEAKKGSRAKKPHLKIEDVNAYAESKGGDVTKERVHVLVHQALAGVHVLQRRLEFLENALGARINPPAVTEESVLSTFADANEDLDEPPVSVQRLLHWARFFIGVGEEFFDVLEAATDREDSWAVFTDLAQVIVEKKPSEPEFELQAAYSYIEVGRRNLRTAVFVHLCSRLGIRAAVKTLGEAEDVHDEVLSFAHAEMSKR